MKFLSIFFLIGWAFWAGTAEPEALPKQKLSEYGFFAAPLAQLQPTASVTPYSVNAPLFSDYGEKSRFYYLPTGGQVRALPDSVFVFPEGAVLIKHFFCHENQKTRLLETRLLILEKKGWKGLTYVWDAAQSDATLEVAGATLTVPHPTANKLIDYYVPNLNQCKGCHAGSDGKMQPIGLVARQLNRPLGSAHASVNQLTALFAVPDSALAAFPKMADYSDAKIDLEARARAYLDGNCGYCHRHDGAANTSGLFLDIGQTNPEAIGVNKAPVAAGRGTGDRKFGIVPGKPDESILLFRMESDDPGIRMPEIGRSLAHREGVELIREWIKKMPH